MKKEEILSYITQLRTLEKIKKSREYIDSLEKLEDRLNDNVFKIVVVGEFSSGKSTFINAIIGKDILSHSTEETTATITYICNVSENDERKNNCIINYRSGSSIQHVNLDDIAKYTTAQSEQNVADDIESVEIFVHFLNVNHPIMIVDTPGLNGVADKHREITIEEIQRAHACVYILPLKGLSASDIDFINILQKYQSYFIFIQNFRDELKVGEGETPENKIEQIKKILNDEFFSKGIEFHYFKLICLSALMNLVAKDKNIQSLYENSEPLSAEDREKLRENSNFLEFENALVDLINSGEYMNSILDAVTKTLLGIVNFFIEEANISATEMQKLLESDSKYHQTQLIQEKISKIESNKNENEKKLETFVMARKFEAEKLCKEFVEEQMNQTKDKVRECIDMDLKKYEDVKMFANLHSNKTIAKYYSEICNSFVIGIKTELDVRIENLAQQIFVKSLLQAKKYEGIDSSKSTNEYSVDFSNFSVKDFNEDSLVSEREKIKRKQIEVSQINTELLELESKINDDSSKQILENELSQETNKYNQIIIDLENKNRNLGEKPQYKSWETPEEYTVYEQRPTIFGWIIDNIFGEKQVRKTRYISHDNSEEIQKWETKHKKILNEKCVEEQEHNSKCEEIKSKLEHLNSMKQRDKSKKERLENEIRRLEEDLRDEETNIDFLEKNAKAELLSAAKKDLIKLLNDECEKMTENLCDYFRNVFNVNANKIKESVLIEYEKIISEKIGELRCVLNGNINTLKEKYNVNEKDLTLLESIKNKIVG